MKCMRLRPRSRFINIRQLLIIHYQVSLGITNMLSSTVIFHSCMCVHLHTISHFTYLGGIRSQLKLMASFADEKMLSQGSKPNIMAKKFYI